MLINSIRGPKNIKVDDFVRGCQYAKPLACLNMRKKIYKDVYSLAFLSAFI